MTTTIQQAFRPLFLMCFIVGLCVYPLKKPNFRRQWVVYLSILYFLTVWFVYGYLLYYMVSSVSIEVLFPATISLIVLEINIIIAVTSIIINVYYNKRLQICMKKLIAVDDTLEELGSPKINRKMHMWSKRIVTGWIVCSFVLNFNDAMSWIKGGQISSWQFFIPHLYNYSFHVNAFVDSIFITFLWYIGTRFDEVNKHMQNLLVKKEHWLRNTWKKPAIIVHQWTLRTDNYKRVLWSSMHLHLELCRIAREWNLMYGTQMTFEMASYLLFITTLFYYLYKLLMRKHREEISACVWLRVATWTFVFMGKIYTINYVCENVTNKANKIDKIINELTNTLRYADIWKEIYQYTLQTMRHPLKFTGMGLFYFGNEFLIKFCVTITTFVIIMIQMSTA